MCACNSSAGGGDRRIPEPTAMLRSRCSERQGFKKTKTKNPQMNKTQKRSGEQLKITTCGPLCSTCTRIHAPIYACVHTYTQQHTFKKESVPQHIDFRKCLEFFSSELKIHTIRHSTVRSFICYPFQCPHYLMSTTFDDPPLSGSFDGTNSLVTFPERMPFGKLYEALLIYSQTRQRPLFTVSEHGESRCSDWGMKHQSWVKRPVQPAHSLPSLPWLHLNSTGPWVLSCHRLLDLPVLCLQFRDCFLSLVDSFLLWLLVSRVFMILHFHGFWLAPSLHVCLFARYFLNTHSLGWVILFQSEPVYLFVRNLKLDGLFVFY